MTARIGSVGSEAFSRTERISTGLNSVIRDHMVAFNPSRVDMLLGLASHPQASPGHDASELSEEDVWGAAAEVRLPPEEGTSLVSDVGSSIGGGSSSSSTKDVVDTDPFRFMTNGRRWLGREKDSGLSVAYTDAGRTRGFPSPLNRATSATGNGTNSNGVGLPGRTLSRLIPSRDISSPRFAGAGSSRVLHQSAPVEVPDWSKILGTEKKHVKETIDDDVVAENDEDDRLPPHELIAKEYARSQVATFSMCEGAGRTLKGRDLSRVRTAVLRQTGFLNDQ